MPHSYRTSNPYHSITASRNHSITPFSISQSLYFMLFFINKEYEHFFLSDPDFCVVFRLENAFNSVNIDFHRQYRHLTPPHWPLLYTLTHQTTTHSSSTPHRHTYHFIYLFIYLFPWKREKLAKGNKNSEKRPLICLLKKLAESQGQISWNTVNSYNTTYPHHFITHSTSTFHPHNAYQPQYNTSAPSTTPPHSHMSKVTTVQEGRVTPNTS